MSERVSTSSAVFITDLTIGSLIAIFTIVATVLRLVHITRTTYRTTQQKQQQQQQQIAEETGSSSTYNSNSVTKNGSFYSQTGAPLMRAYSSDSSSMEMMAIYGLDKRSRQSYLQLQSRSSSPLKKNASLLLKDNTYLGYEKAVRDKWSQHIEDLSTHIDLPRLYTKMEFYSNGKKIWPQVIDLVNEEKKETMIKSLLLALSSYLEPDDVVASINSKFASYFSESSQQDLGRRLKSFLSEVVGNDSKTVKILKGCNQSIIATSVVRLKHYLGSEFPYLDVQGAWRITISITEDDIQVIHRKWEQSYVTDSFRFEWEFKMIFDTEMTDVLRASLNVCDLRFGPVDNEQRRESVKKAISNCVSWS